jgi:hypothetical protein
MAMKDTPMTQRRTSGPRAGGDQTADGTGHGVIGQRRDEDACNDGDRASELRRQQHGEQLCLVAHFAEGDHTG